MPKRSSVGTKNRIKKTEEDAIVRRLNIIIHLLLKQVEHEDADEAARAEIKMLKDLGLTYTEIATILGKSVGYIGSALSKLKKKKKTSAL